MLTQTHDPQVVQQLVNEESAWSLVLNSEFDPLTEGPRQKVNIK